MNFFVNHHQESAMIEDLLGYTGLIVIPQGIPYT